MATKRRSTRSTSSRRSSGSGGSIARFLLPVAALGIGAYLLWPKTASAAVLPPPAPGPAPSPPNPLPPPPLPGGGGGGSVSIESVADAPLTGGTSRGRIVANDVVVRNGFNDTSPIVSRLPLNAGVAVMIGPPSPPTPNAPQGRLRVRTARGAEGYVAVQFLRIDAPPAPGTAGYYR